MTTTATATIDPSYGVVSGYTDEFDQNGTPSNIANVITVPPSSVVQFVNLEPLGPQPSPGATPTTINHSGAALPTAFPSPSYMFPSAEQAALGTTISSALWSTGPVAQDFTQQVICYSQAFTVPSTAGIFAFGDLTFFALTNMRDVVVVSSSARVRHIRTSMIRRPTPKP